MSIRTQTATGSRRVRVVCPHNCYDTCSQIATVENGILRRIDGDPEHSHTRGRLCAKGYSYVDRVYARDRVRHPMIQEPRRSGHWRRISWEEALGRIALKLIGMKDRYGSLLPLCLYQGSGNMGLLHEATRVLFNSMGPITESVNNLCWTTGRNATRFDFGAVRNSDPAELQQAETVLLWGVNPAWTAPHQMGHLLDMRDRGVRLITVDPVGTATASLSDMHLPVRPGTDCALALGMARHLRETGQIDQAFVEGHTLGWESFLQYLDSAVTVEWAAAETGLLPGQIRQVADQYARGRPAAIWLGHGLQRYGNSGQAVRAINALGALTGQIGQPGAGVHYAHRETWILKEGLQPDDDWPGNRTVAAGDLVGGLRALSDPPVRMLWIARANPLVQAPGSEGFRRLLASMEMVVVVDPFMTATAAQADLVLPATTYLEQHDLNVSYWHHDLALNTRAIDPLFEARSELAIAQALGREVNRIRESFATFPTEGDEQAWLERAWTPAARTLFQVDSPTDLQGGPRRAGLPRVAWQDLRFATPSGRYEFSSEQAVAAGAPALPVYAPPAAPPVGFPLRLLTPHGAESINSQFPGQPPVVELHPETAAALGVAEGEEARLASPSGALHLPVRLTRTVPPDCAVVLGGHMSQINLLTQPRPSDMADTDGLRGLAYADTFIAITPVGG